MRSRRARLALLVVLVFGALFAWRRTLARLDEAGAGGGALPAAASALSSRRAAASPIAVRLVEIARGLRHPLFATHAGDGGGRLFVVEQGGTIRIVRDGKLVERPFLDASKLLDTDAGERGLLGLAFAPDYRRSGVFYIAHTAPGPAGKITRLRVSDDPDRADPATASTVLSMDDPASNHNGGMIAFGPDGKLWIGTGDGGRGGDPWDNARDPRSLLGKMLRIDPAGERYAIPPDNPFARSGGRPEVWALGLRNPWRFSFDRATGELWIGDVGQNAREEIDVEDPRTGGGRHYGWKTMEGRHCFSPGKGCETKGLELPIHDYGHDEGCSVTGGYVYRGKAIPALVGHYLFSDYCTGTLWSLVRDREGHATVSTLLESRRQVSSFGEDEAGELYLCDHAGGLVLKLAPGG